MRTTEELVDRLSEERIWRVKEISTILSLASRPQLKPIEVEFYCRAGSTLIYSHFEGFVKRTAVHYLKHIAFQRLQLAEMADFVLCLYIKQAIGTGLETDRVVKLGSRLLREQDFRPKIRWKEQIETESNLSSTTFRRILAKIGIDPILFEAKLR